MISQCVAQRGVYCGEFERLLVCYESQLGDIERAKKHLGHAIELRGELRRAALEDSDLKPLWDTV